MTTLYDPDTLLTQNVSVPDLLDTSYGYDSRGRLTAINTGTRETTLVYNPQRFLESVTDPENHTTSYTYDPVGRVTEIRKKHLPISITVSPKPAAKIKSLSRKPKS